MTFIICAEMLRLGRKKNVKHHINSAKCTIYLAADGNMSVAVINNVLQMLFDVTVKHTLLSMDFKGHKTDQNCNQQKENILSTINQYDQGYCLLEGVSANSLKIRELDQHINVNVAPKTDMPAHILPFFKCTVNNQTMIHVQWDTYSCDQKRPIELHPLSDLNQLQSKLLYNYNIIYIYGIEQTKHETDRELIMNLRKELHSKVEQQQILKLQIQEIQDKLSKLNKRKRAN